MANGKKIVCRQAGPSGSVMIGAITLTSCARHTAFTRSACFSKQMRRLPTTTASVTEYWSSSSRGAYGHVFTSVIFPLSLKRSEYQTFHSSNCAH